MNIQNTANLDTRALTDDELDLAIGGGKGGVTYYEMNGHWYIVGHNKYGQSTGTYQVS